MDFNEYQLAADRTMRKVPGAEQGHMSIYCMGLAGEVGEVIEHFKKYLGHGRPLDIEKVKAELGDVLWYLSAIATTCDISLEKVAEYNVRKLVERYPNGFRPEDVKP